MALSCGKFNESNLTPDEYKIAKETGSRIARFINKLDVK